MTVRVDLWLWRLDDPDPRDLSDDERARASRFLFPRDRDRYLAGRARLRRILAGYVGQGAEALRFAYGAHGRPQIDGIDGIDFNLSHTGDLAALAVSRGVKLGIDIEAMHPIDMDVARRHFASAELTALMALPDAAQVPAFYRCWTRKEAYLKALGTGLTTDLGGFVVTLAPAAPARLAHCKSGDAAAWSLHDIAPAEDIAGALAVRSAGCPVEIIRRDDG